MLSVLSLIKIPFVKYAIIALIFLGLIYAGHRYSFNMGVTSAELKHAIDIQEERDRIEAINHAAAVLAEIELERLREVIKVRDANIARILKEAKEDVDAARGAISSDSVRRINSVQ